MADKQANLIVNLVDKASAGLSRLKGSLIAVGAALSAMTAFAVSSIKAFIEQETATNKLNIALKNQGIFSQQLSQDLQNYATQLQKVTTFSDETIIETQALLTSFGLAGQQLKDTTKAALDLSKGLGIDLRTATMLLGKAAVGEIGTLSRFGIKIDENIPKSEQFAAVLGQVNQRFGGSAQAALNTYAGKLENFTNRVDDLKERIGAELIPIMDFWLNKLESLLGLLERLNVIEAQNASQTNEVVQGIIDKKLELIRVSTEEGTFQTEETQRRLQNLDALIFKEKEKLEKRKANLAIDKTETRTHLETVARLEKEDSEKRKKEQDKLDKQELERDEKRKQQLMNFLNFVSSAQNSNIRAIASVAKAAAIFQVTIDTYRAAQGAYAALSPIPIVGPALGRAAYAVALATGLANVATISGLNLAEGGIVMPTTGGTIARIGEAGSPEAVIPLDDERAGSFIGGPTINIYVGTLVADDLSVREFAKRIDEELFALNRNRQSVSLG